MSNEEEEKKMTSLVMPTTVISKIKEMTREYKFSRMSRLISYVFYKHSEVDPVVTVPLIRNPEVKNPIEGLTLIAQEEAKRFMRNNKRVILDVELAMCGLRRSFHLKWPQMIFQEILQLQYIFSLALKYGLRVGALVNPFSSYSRHIVKEVEVNGEKWILDVLIDICLGDTIWYICRGELDPKSFLIAWIHKCVANARRAFIFSFSGGRIVEIEVTENHLKNIAEELGLDLKDSEKFIKDLVVINLKELRTPFWPNECDACPYKVLCIRYRERK